MQDLMELVPMCFAESHMSRYAQRTASAVRAFYDWHVREYGCAPQLHDLTFDVFKRYFHWLSAITTPSTFNLRRHWLKGFCDWAVMKGYLPANPIDRVPCAKRSSASVVHRRNA
jgi:hypothetical protein